MSKSNVISGIQTTSFAPHLGNYLGSLRHWLSLQEISKNNECFFMLVDAHALTTCKSRTLLRNMTFSMTKSLLCLGIKPENLFIQSNISQHMQLHWILSCLASTSSLNKMTQWKSKSNHANNLGLYSYPVLQAADILLYRANYVPVGEDQKQHLELTRDLAQLFNQSYQESGYQMEIPTAIFTPSARIMSLCNPLKKMSKSELVNEFPQLMRKSSLGDSRDQTLSAMSKSKSIIFMTDSPDQIKKKIYKSLISQRQNAKICAGTRNLLRIYHALSTKVQVSQHQVDETGDDYILHSAPKTLLDDPVKLKASVTELLVEEWKPFRERFESDEFGSRLDHIPELLTTGTAKARRAAENEYNLISNAVGLQNNL